MAYLRRAGAAGWSGQLLLAQQAPSQGTLHPSRPRPMQALVTVERQLMQAQRPLRCERRESVSQRCTESSRRIGQQQLLRL
jgi:hypothetical protein